MVSVPFSISLGASGDVVSGTVEGDSLNINADQYRNIGYLKKLIHSNTIRPRFRIMRLNPDDTVKNQIPPEDIASGGSYSENYENGSRRSLSFSLINENGQYTPSVDGIWEGTRFRLDIGIQDRDESTVWFHKGVFVVRSARPSRTSEQKTVSIECGDKFSFLEGKAATIDDVLTIDPGTDIEQIITDALYTNLGNRTVLDYRPIIYHTSFKGRTTPLTVTESQGSTYGALILQLADILSAEVFYNADGRLTLVPILEVATDGDKPVVDNFTDTRGDYQDNDFDFDFSGFVNRILVIGNNVNGHICKGEARNEDPSSPLSIPKIGIRTGEIINDSNITTDMLAQERADYELRKCLIAKTSQSSTVFFNPLLTVNNLVTYSDEFYKLKRERFLVQSISYSLDYSGTMSISTSNLNNLPFVA